MKRCKTCKHWTPEDPKEYGSLLGGGECGNAPQIWDVTEEFDEENNWNGFKRMKPEHAAVLAVVEDGSAYRARLVTMPDFGCVQHEPAAQFAVWLNAGLATSQYAERKQHDERAKAIAVLEKIARIVAEEEKTIEFSHDWGYGSATLTIDGNHTHIGLDLEDEDAAFICFLNSMYDMLIDDRGLSFVGPKDVPA